MADRLLEIVLRVRDEASDVLDQLSGSTSGEGSGVAGLSDKLLLLGVQAGVAGLAIKKAGTFVNDKMDDWQEYVFTVRNLADAFGLSLEETEQLVFISDTYKLSNDALFSTLNKLAREGFGTGTEALNALRLEFQKIEDPADRAGFLFGVAGEQGQKVLGPLVTMTDLEWADLMEGVEALGGIDEEMVGNAEALELATQGIKQEWTELMIKLANFAAPGLTGLLEMLQRPLTPNSAAQFLYDMGLVPEAPSNTGETLRPSNPYIIGYDAPGNDDASTAESMRWQAQADALARQVADAVKDAVERND